MLLRENIYESLRADILSCRRAPGEELRELELAAVFSVSRAPVRDALLRLEREHLVSIHPRQGYRIRPISMAEAREILAYRTVLEVACAAAAAENATPEISRSLEPFRTFEPGGDVPRGDFPRGDFIEYNRAFHAALAQASGNRRMAQGAADLIAQSERLVRVSVAGIKGRDPAQLVAEHGAIIDAVQQRDPRRAARLVKDHVAKAERRVLDALERSAIVA